MTRRRITKTRERKARGRAGSEIIRGLKGMRDALAQGERLPERFTMRTVVLSLEPGPWVARDIVALRNELNVSQSVFARLLGTSVKTVQGWEQGGSPPPMARRLLDCIRADPAPWEELLREGARAKAAA